MDSNTTAKILQRKWIEATEVLSTSKSDKKAVEEYEMQEIFKKPMCIISTNENGKLCFEKNVLTQIEAINVPMVVVAIVGLYRTGKSYLMNRLAGQSEGFPLGVTIESKTKGIWAWCRKHPKLKDTVLLLLDTEGLGDVAKGDPGHDNRIFTLAVLLCNVLVYNMMTAFNEDAVEKLTFISEMSKNISFKNRTACTKEEDQLDLILPTFVLCLRDFTLQLVIDDEEVTADQYLEASLQLKPGTGPDIERYNRPRESIRRYFPVRKCFTFDMPGTRKTIQALDKTPLKKLQKTFIEETNKFLDYIYQCKPKVLLHSKPVTGNMFAPLVETYVSAISDGAIPDVDDAILVVANIENERLAKIAVEEFQKYLGEVDLPILQTEDFDKLRIFIVNSSLTKFRSEAVFNPEKHELRAIEEMDKLWEIHKAKNLNLVKNHCEDVLIDVYKIVIGKKKINTTYQKIGGYDEYKADIATFKAAYRDRLKGCDDYISQEVLSLVLEEEITTETQIRMADKKLSEEERKAASDRMQEEHRQDIKLREKSFDEKVRKETERADALKKQIEANRIEYAQQETKKQALFNVQMANQREVLERQITMMKEESKNIRDKHQREINDLTFALTKKEQETRLYYERCLMDKSQLVEAKDRELKDYVARQRAEIRRIQQQAEQESKRDKQKIQSMESEVYRLQHRGLFGRVFNW